MANEWLQKTGSKPVMRIIITTSGGSTDITSYYKSGANLELEKSRMPDDATIVVSGDVTLVFSNHTGLFTETDAGSIFYGTVYSTSINGSVNKGPGRLSIGSSLEAIPSIFFIPLIIDIIKFNFYQ